MAGEIVQRVVTGIYQDGKRATEGVVALLEAHFENDDIQVVVDRPGGRYVVPIEYDSPWAKGAAIGAIVGLVLGIIGSALVAWGLLPSPGMGLITGNPWLATMKGAFVASASGALFGYLMALAVWSSQPHLPEEEVANARVLVGVRVSERRVAAVREALEKTGPLEVTVCVPGDAACEQAVV